MSKADCPILMMRSSDISLEDIFIQLTTDEPGEGGAPGAPESKEVAQ
jgi:hypothetical protein